MKITSITTVVSAVILAAQVAPAGNITGTIILKGTPPPEQQITQAKDDVNCGKLHTTVPTTQHWVVGKKGELANVVVMLKGISGKSTGASAPPAELDQKGCIYVPSIMAIQTGQKLHVKNSDPVLHNVHTVSAAGNTDQNLAQMANGPDLSFSFTKSENFLKFKCDVHQWMFAWVTVVDHPYFAVSDKDGKFTIKNVPAGKYTVQALHRKAAPNGLEKDVEVKDGDVTVDFTMEVK